MIPHGTLKHFPPIFHPGFLQSFSRELCDSFSDSYRILTRVSQKKNENPVMPNFSKHRKQQNPWTDKNDGEVRCSYGILYIEHLKKLNIYGILLLIKSNDRCYKWFLAKCVGNFSRDTSTNSGIFSVISSRMPPGISTLVHPGNLSLIPPGNPSGTSSGLLLDICFQNWHFKGNSSIVFIGFI